MSINIHFFYRKSLLILLVLWCLDMQAQSKQPALSLHDAISLSWNHYPSVREKMALVNAGRAAVIDARHAWLPSVKLMEQVNAGTSNNLGGSYFPMGIVPSIVGGIRSSNKDMMSSSNISVADMEWEVYNFGAYKAITQEALSALLINQTDLEKEKFLLQNAVIQSYLDLLKYDALRKIQAENVQRTYTILDAIRSIVRNGLKAGVDSSIAAAELSKARLNYLDINNQYELIKNRLATFTGLDSAAIVPDTSNNNALLSLLNLSQNIDSSNHLHPILQYYQSVYHNNLARQKVIQRSYLPKVFLLGAGWLKGSSIVYDDVFQKNLGTGLNYNRYNYMAGVGITYNLFDFKKMQDKLAVQKMKSEAALHAYEEQKELINDLYRQATSNIQTAIARLNEIPVQLSAATDAYQQRLALYNSGLTNIIDVTNALYVLNRAEIDYVNAKDAAWKAVFQKAYASNQISQLLSSLK